MPALKIIIQQPQNLHRNQFSQLRCGLCWQSQYCWSAARDEKKPHSTYRIKQWIIHTEIREGGEHLKNYPNATFKKYQEHVRHSMEP